MHGQGGMICSIYAQERSPKGTVSQESGLSERQRNRDGAGALSYSFTMKFILRLKEVEREVGTQTAKG